MSTEPMTTNAALRTRTTVRSRGLTLRLSVGALATTAVAAVLLLISMVGPTWLHVPANPAARIPALELSFSDLHKLTNTVPSPGEQHAYFAWLSATLAVVTVGAAAIWAGTSSRVGAVTVALFSFASLIFTAFAVKGALMWNQLFHGLKDIRIGGYLLLVAYVGLLVASSVALGSGSRRTV